jgi:RNA-directed DNA polymerase
VVIAGRHNIGLLSTNSEKLMLASSALFKDEVERFLKLSSRVELAEWLNLSDSRLRFLLYGLDASERYKQFSIRKRNGGQRSISAPNRALMAIQRSLQHVLAHLGKPSAVACGFVPGKSIVDHAKSHRKKRWVLCIDLKDFFPSIKFWRVRGMFMAAPFGFNAEVATCLAQICTNEQCLPQGAPTSPVISNIICLSLDRRIKDICRLAKCDYTRYADDLCISSNLKEIPVGLSIEKDGVWSVGKQIEKAIEESGFEVNHKKTKLKFQRDRQMVTGLVVNRHVSMPRVWRRQLRVMLHLRKKHGDKHAMSIVKTWSRGGVRRKGQQSIDGLISGKAGFAAHLEKKRSPSFILSLYLGYPGSRHLIPKPYKAYRFRILTEGITDQAHLSAAMKHFVSRGAFDLAPSFPKMYVGNGSSALLGELRRISNSISDELTIGIVDYDELDVMRREQLEPGLFNWLGGSTYVMCIARPNNVVGRFCIEDLYQWSEASAYTSEGRRLFKAMEFDENGQHRDGAYRLEGKCGDSLYITAKVVRIDDNQSCLLSKNTFSQMITAQADPFNAMNFDGFRPTFEIFNQIIEDYLAK